jgi:acetyltransferase-like isoleucine patch superfamily enzyme
MKNKLFINFVYFLFKLLKNNKIRGFCLKIIIKYLDSKDNYLARLLMKDFYDINIGKYSYGCYKTDGSIAKGTKIGSFCSIAPGVRIGGMNHPTKFVSTHPFLYYKIEDL